MFLKSSPLLSLEIWSCEDKVDFYLFGPPGIGSAGGNGPGQRKQQVVLEACSSKFSTQQGPYVPSLCRQRHLFQVLPTIGFDPTFQAMMLEMMRQNSRIELMDRRLSAEEKRREEEEAARKAANVPLVGPVDGPVE